MWERNFLAASSVLLNKRNLYMVCEFFFLVMVCVRSNYLGGFKVKSMIIWPWNLSDHALISEMIKELHINTQQAARRAAQN